MSEVKQLIEAANRLNDALIDERKEVAQVREKLEQERSKVEARSSELADREAAVLAREQAVSGLENANKILSKAEEIKQANKNLQKEIDDRIQECQKVERAAKEAIEKLERDRFDFEAAKRAHSTTRREFEEQKKAWEEKVAKLGIKVA